MSKPKNQVKLCVYFKREDASTWVKYWVGGRGQDGEGVRNRPKLTSKLFLEFAFRNGWISPGDVLTYLIIRDKQVIEAELREMGISTNGI